MHPLASRRQRRAAHSVLRRQVSHQIGMARSSAPYHSASSRRAAASSRASFAPSPVAGAGAARGPLGPRICRNQRCARFPTAAASARAKGSRAFAPKSTRRANVAGVLNAASRSVADHGPGSSLRLVEIEQVPVEWHRRVSPRGMDLLDVRALRLIERGRRILRNARALAAHRSGGKTPGVVSRSARRTQSLGCAAPPGSISSISAAAKAIGPRQCSSKSRNRASSSARRSCLVSGAAAGSPIGAGQTCSLLSRKIRRSQVCWAASAKVVTTTGASIA